jgi:addiction module HigA family antidote
VDTARARHPSDCEDADRARLSTKNARPSRRLRDERTIDTLGLTVTRAASVLGVTRPALSALVNERAAPSSEMAFRLEKAFGVSMDTLMRMQNS